MPDRRWAEEEALRRMDEVVLGPDLAPSYVERSPLGVLDTVHVITTLGGHDR